MNILLQNKVRISETKLYIQLLQSSILVNLNECLPSVLGSSQKKHLNIHYGLTLLFKTLKKFLNKLYSGMQVLTKRVSCLPLPALPTATLYVGSPPWLFVRMSIVQSPSTYRLSLITEHFFAPRVKPLVKKPSRSFPTIISISTGCPHPHKKKKEEEEEENT